jgi:Tat protein secretion system quality control protein TatD with DNase activity
VVIHCREAAANVVRLLRMDYERHGPVRGRRNEPTFVVHTWFCLATVQGVEPAALAEQTTQNART